MARPVDLWLKAHGAGERALARDLQSYFAGQAERAADAMADIRKPSTGDLAGLLNEADETALLLDVVMPHVATLAGSTAEGTVKKYTKAASGLWLKAEFSLSGVDSSKKPTPEDYIPDDLPAYLKDAILDFMGELEERPYWKLVQAGTNEQISMVVAKGLEDGLSGSEMAKEILKQLGGNASKARAEAIARTETTGAMNAGHQAGYEYLAEDELLTGKTWLVIDDDRLRESHADLSEVTVGVNEDFDVGGNPAPYPGHYSLPAEERVNCRCTTIAAIADV